MLQINRPDAYRLPLLLILALLAFQPERAAAQSPQGLDENATKDPGVKKIPLDPWQKAVAAKEKGDCPGAIPMLEPFARRGHGFEVAQLSLGQCYLTVAQTIADPQEAKKSQVLGATWIVKAANAGLPAAQMELIRLALGGDGFQTEPAEAGKWYLLWRRNPSRQMLGNVELDSKLALRLKTTLNDADWKTATALANRWQPVEEAETGPQPHP